VGDTAVKSFTLTPSTDNSCRCRGAQPAVEVGVDLAVAVRDVDPRQVVEQGDQVE
jgi:hypothetical protein